MSTLILIRHGRTGANADGVLAGWTPGVFLDAEGEAQAARLGERLAEVRLDALIASPLDRAVQTADAVAARQHAALARHIDERVGECRYGEWEGQPLSTLAEHPLWPAVQAHPASVRFPGGESMAQMQHRAVAAIRDWNEALGADALYAVVSHGDVIKAVLADALGMHLDAFQRIQVDPGSVSVITYTPMRPFIARVNDTGSLDSLARALRRERTDAVPHGDAAIGGGAGG